jgi:predicted amidohydrolase/ribosomal protein S18 acetylase RimI-like enzyme
MPEMDLSRFEKEIVVRNIQHEDIDEIVEMATVGFDSPEIGFKRAHYESHLEIFPEGQVCIEYKGKIIGSCSSLIVNFDEYDEEHTIDEITDHGFIRNHNPNGVNLYGTDVVVHPDYRHMKIGRRLYEARRRICRQFNLQSIVFGGRIPNYHKYADQMTPEEYVDQVIKKNIYDPVLTFQMMNGFEYKRILPNYLPDDHDSLEYATLMEWKNPDYVPEPNANVKHSLPVRVAAIQYRLKEIHSFDDFAAQCEYYVDASSKVRSDFVVFPENLNMQLLSFLGETVPSKQVRKTAEYQEKYIQLFTDLAIRYSINIIAGSQLVVENDSLYSAAYLFRRNGTIDKQYKLHVSTDERKWWGLQPGKGVRTFDTDCGKIAIFTGYDVQFPELARIAVDKGAQIIFTPFSVTDQQGYWRVRYCSQARAVENQVFTVMAGMVGNLSHVHHLNTQYAQSGIFTPVDFSFPNQGIVAECGANIETMVVGEVDLGVLQRYRHAEPMGSLKN